MCVCVFVYVCVHMGSPTTIPNQKLKVQPKIGAPRWFGDKVGGTEVCDLSFVPAFWVILQCSSMETVFHPETGKAPETIQKPGQSFL